MAKRKTSSGITKRVALYLPVSTTGQTTVNQRRELEAVANRHLAIVLAQHISGAHSASGRTSEATTSAGSPAEVFEMSTVVTRRGRSRSAGSTALSPRTRTPSSIEPIGPRNRAALGRYRPPSS